jgi:hypothetical protein
VFVMFRGTFYHSSSNTKSDRDAAITPPLMYLLTDARINGPLSRFLAVVSKIFQG